ncbi:MAG: metallophosphoesterase [Candidatus Bathyarchaeota archaeon]|nr:metallophosphoesterase [Candidatus Bathyarchaeota archaeon]
MDYSKLFGDAFTLSKDRFIEAVAQVTDILRVEKGRVGNLTINKRLVEHEPVGEALVVGDLHGDLQSLKLIIETSQFEKKMEKRQDATMIFLGDYGDRGPNSVGVYYVILKLKLAFPSQVVLLRGNHEAPDSLLGVPHDLPDEFMQRFGGDWQLAYEAIKTLWGCLYNAVSVKERYLMVHGGVSPQIHSLDDLAKDDSDSKISEDLLWSDPDEQMQGIGGSPRGAGILFGKHVTEEVLERVNAKVLIRGHEASRDGFRINHNGKVLTLFSRKGSPYYNRFGAYLQLPLAEEFETASDLSFYIHKF